MMDKLLKEVEESVEKEYGRAAAKFGCTNNSDHESYAILKEELEEAQFEVERVNQQLQGFWNHTKANDSDMEKYSRLLELERCAQLAACEFIQVAAMAKKAAMTVAQGNIFITLPDMEGSER